MWPTHLFPVDEIRVQRKCYTTEPSWTENSGEKVAIFTPFEKWHFFTTQAVITDGRHNHHTWGHHDKLAALLRSARRTLGGYSDFATDIFFAFSDIYVTSNKKKKELKNNLDSSTKSALFFCRLSKIIEHKLRLKWFTKRLLRGSFEQTKTIPLIQQTYKYEWYNLTCKWYAYFVIDEPAATPYPYDNEWNKSVWLNHR